MLIAYIVYDREVRQTGSVNELTNIDTKTKTVCISSEKRLKLNIP